MKPEKFVISDFFNDSIEDDCLIGVMVESDPLRFTTAKYDIDKGVGAIEAFGTGTLVTVDTTDLYFESDEDDFITDVVKEGFYSGTSVVASLLYAAAYTDENILIKLNDAYSLSLMLTKETYENLDAAGKPEVFDTAFETLRSMRDVDNAAHMYHYLYTNRMIDRLPDDIEISVYTGFGGRGGVYVKDFLLEKVFGYYNDDSTECFQMTTLDAFNTTIVNFLDYHRFTVRTF